MVMEAENAHKLQLGNPRTGAVGHSQSETPRARANSAAEGPHRELWTHFSGVQTLPPEHSTPQSSSLQ